MATHTISFPGADINTTQLTVGTGGISVDTATFVVDAGTNRVGIGSTLPTSSLDVVGAVTLSDTLSVNGVGTFSSTTEATTITTGALTTAGGISTQTNVHASNVYTHGGLITNRAGTCKKTYSHKGTLPTNSTILQGTFTVVFSAHVFAAKIYGTLIEGDADVSSITFECCGGHRTGGTGNDIVIGNTVVVGSSACPWSTVVTTDPTTVTFKISEDVVGDGTYDIFVEYLSSHLNGQVVKFTEGGSDEITFNY